MSRPRQLDVSCFVEVNARSPQLLPEDYWALCRRDSGARQTTRRWSVLLLLGFQFGPAGVEGVDRVFGGLEPGVAGL